MADYGNCPGYLGLRPTWKGNLCLLLVAAVFSASTFFLITTPQNDRWGGSMLSDRESGLAGFAVDGKKRTIELSSGLGRNALVFDEDDVIHLLKAAVERF